MSDDGKRESFIDEMKYCFKETCNTNHVKPFIGWSCWNIIRYIIVGCFIFDANRYKNNHLVQYQDSCCGCYYVSLEPEIYNIESNKRFDLSYCVPNCADCNFCSQHYSKNASKAFIDINNNNNNCPIANYNDTHSNSFSFNKNWYTATGCAQEQQSITFMMKCFKKSYEWYGKIALIVTIIYSIFNVLCIVLIFCMNDMSQTLFRWTWIYNIFISEICLYLIFKPFQYKTKQPDNTDGVKIQCQVDSISENYEDILTYCIYISLGLTISHLLWMIAWIIFYIAKCIKSYQRDHRGRNVSISMDKNQHVQQGKVGRYIKLSSNKGNNYKKCAFLWGFVGIVVFILMLFFLILTVILGVTTWNQKDMDLKDIWKNAYIIYPLLGFSLIDSPWIWRKAKGITECNILS